MSDRPLARIQLPRHHPSISGMKKGGIVLHASPANDTEEENPIGMGHAPAPRPMPLHRNFNITKIGPMDREPNEDQKDAVKYLKKSMRNGGRSVS